MKRNLKFDFKTYLAKALIHIQGESMVLPYYLKSSKNVGEIAVFAPNWLTSHFRGDAIWFREYILALTRRKVKLNLVSNVSEVQHGQMIIWRPSSKWVPSQLRFSGEKSEKLIELARSIERKGATPTPNSRVISYYENKINMHDLFTRVGVRSPCTYVINTKEEYDEVVGKISEPFIIKGPYSCSSLNIYLIENDEQDAKFREWMFPLQNENGKRGSDNNLSLPILIRRLFKYQKRREGCFCWEKDFAILLENKYK